MKTFFQNIHLLVWWGRGHFGILVQQEVLLGDTSAAGVDGDHGETHLQDPAVHDFLQCVGQSYVVALHCLTKGRFAPLSYHFPYHIAQSLQLLNMQNGMLERTGFILPVTKI